MGCNAEYMVPNLREIAGSKVATLLDELTGKEFNKSHWRGHHPKVYNNRISQDELDRLTATLCSKLQTADVTKYSLELQTWWRDHQLIDKRRVEQEIKEEKDERAKDEALAKLTDYERKLLGV